jgi:hypothetical protein
MTVELFSASVLAAIVGFTSLPAFANQFEAYQNGLLSTTMAKQPGVNDPSVIRPDSANKSAAKSFEDLFGGVNFIRRDPTVTGRGAIGAC